MSETQERGLRKREASDRFDQLYSDWLNARAAAADPRLPRDDKSVVRERDDRRDAAARALLAEPIVEPWMIWPSHSAYFRLRLISSDTEKQEWRNNNLRSEREKWIGNGLLFERRVRRLRR